MKILVNAIPLMGLVTGISRYLRALYHELGLIPGIQVGYFTGDSVLSSMPPAAQSDKWIKNRSYLWKLPDVVILAIRSIRWLLYEYRLQRVIGRGDYDVYHETAYFPARMTGIPMVYSLYDLSLIGFRDRHPRERVWFYDLFLNRRLQYASHILTISRFIESEIHSILKIPPDQISSVPLAADTFFSPGDPSQVGQVLKKMNIPKAYFLFVGSLEPRKNLDLIIKAMALQKNPLPLVLAGWTGWGDKPWLLEVERSGLDQKLILVGYVDDKTLSCLYSGAHGLIFPSLYEGFGLPVLEAMACGCPVICSNTSSLPEAAGDAALQIDPHRPDELAEAMDRVAADASLRSVMIRKGIRQAGLFSWKKTARNTLRVFEHTINGHGK